MTQVTPLAQLQVGDQGKSIEVRVYRKWVTRSTKTQAPTGYCIILIDRMGTGILGNMNYNDKDYFDRKLRLNNTYRLRNFYCESKGAGQRVIATPVSLRFRRNIIVHDVPPTDFPEHCFSFTAANRLSTHVSRNTLLVDYIGCIERVEDLVTLGDPTRKQLIKRRIDVTNLKNEMVQLNLWNEQATAFDDKLYEALEKPVILAVSSCRPKIHNGNHGNKLQLNGSQATHCYFNPNIPEYHAIMNEYRQRYDANPPLQIVPQKYNDLRFEKERNRIPLECLLAQNLRFYRYTDFTCEGVIQEVNLWKNWYYKSCNECHKGAIEFPDEPGVFSCPQHGKQNSCSFTYCFETLISDGTATGTFTFFSTAGNAVVGHTCEELVMGKGHYLENLMPAEIIAIEGSMHTYQFHYNPQSATGYPEFIVDRILTDIAPLTRTVSTEQSGYNPRTTLASPRALTDQEESSAQPTKATETTPTPAGTTTLATPPSAQPTKDTETTPTLLATTAIATPASPVEQAEPSTDTRQRQYIKRKREKESIPTNTTCSTKCRRQTKT